jgi:hypothetical protein
MMTCFQICFKFAFNFNLRRYIEVDPAELEAMVAMMGPDKTKKSGGGGGIFGGLFGGGRERREREEREREEKEAEEEEEEFDNVEEGVTNTRGRAVQVDPVKPTLKAPGTKRLKLEYDGTALNFGFNFNSRRYSAGC